MMGLGYAGTAYLCCPQWALVRGVKDPCRVAVERLGSMKRESFPLFPPLLLSLCEVPVFWIILGYLLTAPDPYFRPLVCRVVGHYVMFRQGGSFWWPSLA